MSGRIDDDAAARLQSRLDAPQGGPYVLRTFLDRVPLKSEDTTGDVHITCVEYWNGNLYVGTSASEILHFVSLSPDPADENHGPTFILASRLQPAGYSAASSVQAPGVRRILLLPGPAKCCILCNGMVSFYSLPELSPAFPNKEPSGVQWIGGIDENEDVNDEEGQVVMIANSKRILLVRVGERLKPVKNNIDYSDCLVASRRDTIACVADQYAYALLEVEHRQKIPLFPISSNDNIGDFITGQVEDLRPQEGVRLARSSSDAHHGPAAQEAQGHSRSTSLGTFVSGISRKQLSPPAESHTPTGLKTPDLRPGNRSPAPATSPERSGLEPSASRAGGSNDLPAAQKQVPARRQPLLQPHIVSPSATEFLLTTGTGANDPGVGLFVNLDGDVVRGTIEFERYPAALIIDRSTSGSHATHPSGGGDEDGNVLALITPNHGGADSSYVQVQSLSSNPVTVAKTKSRVNTSSTSQAGSDDVGMSKLLSSSDHNFSEAGDFLRMVRLRFPINFSRCSESLSDASERQNNILFEEHPIPAWEAKRNKEEMEFTRRLGTATSDVVVWSGDHIWTLARNPLVLQLEALLHEAQRSITERPSSYVFSNERVLSVLEGIRNLEARRQVDFLSLNYIRQKASLLLFINTVMIQDGDESSGSHLKDVESVLQDGWVDPRVILFLIPMLRSEVLQGPEGLWVHQGLARVVGRHLELSFSTDRPATTDFWMLIKRFLTAWQERRGFGSITDEQYVIDSVDASLLHVLLHLEQSLPQGSPVKSSVRAKLNNVVDNWKGNFERAVQLLLGYQRLYVLSRLYQTRALAKEVLDTWRRIAEGEADAGGELSPSAVEAQVRRYLVKIRDPQSVEEYGVWLAQRNADLAIQVFTDDNIKVKFSPQQIITLLKTEAPGAVQQYLEHLVFHKQMSQYGDDLIGYYLDSVLTILEKSQEARDTLAQTYSTYRALRSPKPTYLTFITENAPPKVWWQARLRLLQLLGGHSYATESTSANKELTYSTKAVLGRLAPFSSFLVSESIILDARQGRHKEALRLLTHGLGDYDTAIRYCYFGTPSPVSIVDAAWLPPNEAQRDLFGSLIREFLVIEDISERLERTSSLIGRFAAWFDPLDVLELIPDSWSVDLLGEFLLRSFRMLTSERNEGVVVKALSAAQNLQKQANFIDVFEKLAKVEGTTDQAGSSNGDATDQIVELSQDNR